MTSLLLCAGLALGADSLAVTIHAAPTTLARIASSGAPAPAAVLFLPGDGGWRGAAVAMARRIASWGYEVYGFDTRKYLESGPIPKDSMAEDLRAVALEVKHAVRKPVILVGWSQGAGMAIAAAAGAAGRDTILGVLALGLPESAVLGWDWKATLAVAARRQPDQPTFQVKPMLRVLRAVPLWMIHGSADEYTSAAVSRELFQAAAGTKQLRVIDGANHRFDGHQDELFAALREGLQWAAAN